MGGNYVLIAQICPKLAKAMFHRIKTISSLDKRTLYHNLLERYGRSADYPRKPFTIPVPFFSAIICLFVRVLACQPLTSVTFMTMKIIIFFFTQFIIRGKTAVIG